MKHLIALAVVAPLALAGCQTTGTGSIEVNGSIAAAQEAVRKLCDFVPDEGVVSKLIVFFKPDAAGYLAMAQQICFAVAGPQLRAGRRSTPRLYGVRITGRFVR